MTSDDRVIHVPVCNSLKQPRKLINLCKHLVFNDVMKKEFTIIPGKKILKLKYSKGEFKTVHENVSVI